jgi:hypothetical protein
VSGDLTDADRLAGEDMAEADLALADADAFAVSHGERAIMEGMLRLG